MFSPFMYKSIVLRINPVNCIILLSMLCIDAVLFVLQSKIDISSGFQAFSNLVLDSFVKQIMIMIADSKKQPIFCSSGKFMQSIKNTLVRLKNQT